MRRAPRRTNQGGARRWSRPALLLLLGVAVAVYGVVDLRREPSASVIAFGSSQAAPTPPNAGPPVSPPPAPASEPASPTAAPTTPAPPGTVTLPDGRTRMPVVPVGVLPSGVLQLPEHPGTLGWWSAGPLPGATQGTVVLAGHLDSKQYGLGPLQTLLADDLRGSVEVVGTDGAAHRYTVASRQSYPRARLPQELFAGGGPPRLALVTCGGDFDQRTGHYAENVVVLADPAPAP